MDDRQQILDTYYWTHGPCCAGCDHWQSLNSIIGTCKQTPPSLPGADRAIMISIESASVAFPAGHAITKREHHCGGFADDFPWETLPLAYLKRVRFQR